MPDWSDYVANGEAFAAENFLVPGGGLRAHVQLLNPVASGVRIRLRSLSCTSGLALAHDVCRHDTPLATLGLPVTFITENLLGGGPASAVEHRSVAQAGASGSVFWQISAPANDVALFPPEARQWGFDLLEGQGLLVRSAAAQVVIVNWQWAEVPL